MGIHQIPPATSRKNQPDKPTIHKEGEYELFLGFVIGYTKWPNSNYSINFSLSLSLFLQIRIFYLHLHFLICYNSICGQDVMYGIAHGIVWSEPEATDILAATV